MIFRSHSRHVLRAPARGRARRRGFSLLEVILALAILLGAIAVLGELVRIGTRSAAAARDLSQAQLLCESKLAEASASPTLPSAVNGASFEGEYPEAEGWLYSIEVEPLPDPGLSAVRVTVTQDLPALDRPLTYTLVRWLRDPTYELSGEAAQEQAAGESQEESP